MVEKTSVGPVSVQTDLIRAAGAVLARSFEDDPGSKYVIPEDDLRVKFLTDLFAACVRYGYLYGTSHVTQGEVNGATVWLKPGHTDIPVWKMISSGLATAYLRVGVRRVARALNYLNATEVWHKKYAPGRHWYLFLVGVEPTCQGQGIGSGLIHPVLQQADEEGMPCYLETGKQRNFPFYERLGFKMVGEGQVSGGGPHIWSFLRNPQ